MVPGIDVWLYIRKNEEGMVKYFISNPVSTAISILDSLETMRWSIKQCFQECKSYLVMTYYEFRTCGGWYRHMLMATIAHLFALHLRLLFKKLFITMPIAKFPIAAVLYSLPNWEHILCILRQHFASQRSCLPVSSKANVTVNLFVELLINNTIFTIG